MNTEEIAATAVSRIKERLTDEVFLLIQTDRELMANYLHEVEAHGWKTVNQTIGRAVKRAFPGIGTLFDAVTAYAQRRHAKRACSTTHGGRGRRDDETTS